MSNTAFLGNLTYNQGADFNVVVCDASFEELKQFDEWASLDTNGGRTQNGIGENIKNCFIVCAPQTKADVNYIRHVQTTSYTDVDGDHMYTNGTDSGLKTDSYTYETSIGITDKGDYDLLVTDHLGNLIRLTPPFADYDTRYFSVVSPNNDDKNSYYGARYLTFNEDYQKLLGDTNTIVSSLNVTYTPILNTIDVYKDNNLSSQYITIAYTYSYKDGNKTSTTYGTFAYDRIKDGQPQAGITPEVKEFLYNTFQGAYESSKATSYSDWADSNAINCLNAYCKPEVVSFIELLNKISYLTEYTNRLQKILDSNKIQDVSSYKTGNDPDGTTYWINDQNEKIYAIGDRVSRIENSAILFRANKNIASYLWSGTSDEYSKFISGHKDLSSYIFLHTV